ncbi:uncharacterized protein LOC130656266 [Hydractinia symbiolongicarpus]|uniref:uncharacterized protein LOC130656266 n=1 Tax=Hydractinia symbiolongicarpus TaxID=13093 RepID=UPI00254D6E5F|nr:uncharacterized protein LOC130656266 [Hydractinia symbiolongicarpus]
MQAECLTTTKSRRRKRKGQPRKFVSKTNINPFKCEFCDRLFKAKKGLVVHMKCIHGLSSFQQSQVVKQNNEDKIIATVKSVMGSMLNQIESLEGSERQTLKSTEVTKGRRGSAKRAKYSVKTKADIVNEYEGGASQDSLARKYGINRSLVSKWVKDKEKLKLVAKSEYEKFFKIHPSKKGRADIVISLDQLRRK